MKETGRMNKIGLIAGGGIFPVLFAREAARLGYSVAAVGVKGITSVELEKFAGSVDYFKLGQITRPIETLASAGVRRAVMAGHVPHTSVFGGIVPDFRAAKILLKLKDRKANSILKAVADEFACKGIELVSSVTFLEHLLPCAGALTPFKLNDAQKRDISLGWKAAKTLSGLDVGLTAVVKDMAVVALEGMEGTDACILRAGEIVRKAGSSPSGASASGLVVVKVARPGQDLRFDLPVIGAQTIRTMCSAGAGVLAVEAKKTLILDREQFLKEASAEKMSVVVLKDGKI